MANSEDGHKQCIACFEDIHRNASTCPHCGASQKFHQYALIGQAVKWVGGIVTIISLVVGVVTLNGYYQEWSERELAVQETLEAADWLIQSGDYFQAWSLYKKADEIALSRQNVREAKFNLALKWIKNLKVDKSYLDNTLNELSEVLYLGLPSTEKDQSSTILAHIGHIQTLRKLNRLSISADPENIFEMAFELDTGNAFANAMYGRWLLMKRPMTVEVINKANEHFNTARQDSIYTKELTHLQFSGLISYVSGYSDEIERLSIKSLVLAYHQLRVLDEPDLLPRNKHRILDAYGLKGDAEHADWLVNNIPPKVHLESFLWLSEKDDDSRLSMKIQKEYVIARINEHMGETALATKQMSQLASQLNDDSNKQLKMLVFKSVERLTGKLPDVATRRNYKNDAIDSKNLSEFHLDTLLNSEFSTQSDNLTQAINYFKTRINDQTEVEERFTSALPEFIQSAKDDVKYGDKLKALNAYTTGFGQWHHDAACNNFLALSLLQITLFENNYEYEKAIAKLEDLKKTTMSFEDSFNHNWTLDKALIEFKLARNYASVFAKTEQNKDLEHSLKHLLKSVELGVIEHQDVNWQSIKSSEFKILANNPDYLQLIRGR